MPEPVVSIFRVAFLFWGLCGSVFFIGMSGYFSYYVVFVDLQNFGVVFVLALSFISATVVFFYFFSRRLKIIIVGPDGIEVDCMITKKQLLIPYADITRINGLGGLLIEYKTGLLKFNTYNFENYTELKAAIYNYKYGFDRKRSHY